MNKNIKQNLCRLVFALGFVIILLYPFYGELLGKEIKLSGVSAEVTLQEPSYEGIMDGSYQASLNTWIENHFPGRNLMIKLRSQLMYSMFGESPNANVIVGKEKQLFEPQYIYFEQGIYRTEDHVIQEAIDKLESLDDLLNAQGKELYLFVTPSKAYFSKDDIPSYFNVVNQSGENDYQKFSRMIKDSSVRCFDTHAYIDDYSGNDIEAPVFYPTGIHWSYPWAYSSAKAFAEWMEGYSCWNLGELSLTISPSETPVDPDADLYNSLNLLAAPTGVDYYNASLSVAEPGDKPNVFLRGGSFMGQSLSGLIRAGIFNEDTHFENNYYFMNQYSQASVLSSFTAYDEMTVLAERLSNADILILEMNESNVHNLSWGFVDYLLDHPEFLNYPEQEE